MKHLNRRRFLQAAAATGAGFWIAERVAGSVSRSPNEKLNLGFIGVGGRGAANMKQLASENAVALCDIDDNYLAKAASKHPRARKYNDFRKLLDESRDLDAVVISTTEHTHAFAAIPAIQLNKHIYCEKPLAHDVWETRVVAEAASRNSKIVTQMGNQNHANDSFRRVVELVEANAVGPIRECHVWVARDWGGGDRPTDRPPVPPHLHWDLWLGPAPERPYHPIYFPGPNWYKWWDFGNGTLPDLGAHWNDLPFWALKLKHPLTIEAEGPPPHPETAPTWLIVRWEFPARGNMPPVKLVWYHGGKKPPLVTEGKVPSVQNGMLFVGDEGMILADYRKHTLLPEAKFADYKRPAPTIPSSPGHWAEWVQACKTGSKTGSPFEYGGMLTETNCLGIVAYRSGKKLEWDPVNLKIKNCPEAERFIRRDYRKGWKLV